MKLLVESVENELEYVVENTTDGKEMYIEGIFMQSEVKNRNKRVYPKPVLESAVDSYIREAVNKKRAVGELNHPPNPTVNLDKVSHLTTNLYWEGSDVIGKAKILSTPMGNIARGLIEGGVQLGVSSRGLGSISVISNVNTVNEGYHINAVDIVQDPSAHKAYVNGILEGVDWVMDEAHGVYVQEKVESHREIVEKKYKNIDDNLAESLFKDFLSSIDV
jgi:hypothetical protein